MTDAEMFPMMVYDAHGGHLVVETASHLRKLGAKWSRTPNDNTLAAVRRAAGAVAEIILSPAEIPPTE